MEGNLTVRTLQASDVLEPLMGVANSTSVSRSAKADALSGATTLQHTPHNTPHSVRDQTTFTIVHPSVGFVSPYLCAQSASGLAMPSAMGVSISRRDTYMAEKRSLHSRLRGCICSAPPPCPLPLPSLYTAQQHADPSASMPVDAPKKASSMCSE